jgi:hypothetical protein
MKNINIDLPFTRVSYQNTLLQEFNVSLLAIDNYHDKKQNKLTKIDSIKNPKNDKDTQKCLALLHILTPGNSYGIVSKYCKKNNLEIINDPNVNLLLLLTRYTAKYKLELLTTLVYDDNFFDQVREWYLDISGSKKPIIPIVRHFPQKITLPNEKILKRLTADDDALRFNGFDYLPVKDIAGYSGVFTFFGNDQARRLKIEFQFINDKTTGKLLKVNAIPFYLEITLIADSDKTNIDENGIPIILDIKKESSTICSEEHYFNFKKKYRVSKIINLISCAENTPND